MGEVGGAVRGMEGMEMVGDWTRSRYNLTERNDKEVVWDSVVWCSSTTCSFHMLGLTSGQHECYLS